MTVPTDILLQSRQAKSFLFDRCTLLGLDPFVVAANAGVDKERFTNWINALAEDDLLSLVTPKEVMIIYESIGIFPRLQFVIVPVDDLEQSQKALINKMKNTKS